MSQNKMNHERFPEPSMDEWVQKALQSLKGRSVDTLASATYENIPLKPLYTNADVNDPASTSPGTDDYRRRANTLGYISLPWKIAQRIRTDDIESVKTQLHTAFQNGQTAIHFTPSPSLFKELPQLLADYYQKYSFAINGGTYQLELLETLLKMEGPDKVTGFIGMDPISLYIKNPSLKLDNDYDRLSRTIKKAASAFPQLKTILVNTTPYHNSGANAVQELAIALALGVEHIEKLKKRQLDMNDFYQKIVFHFSIGNQFFMEIAKLRAFRILWINVLSAYGMRINDDSITISAETSTYTKTIYEPYVNLLRAGNEAFAAVIGGVQYLHISPYNELEGHLTDFSERIARNMHHILKDEAKLDCIIDPAGGSWFIESLTNELTEKSWQLFLQIDDRGGIVKAIEDNWLQTQIDEVRMKREEDVMNGKQILVGTNQYIFPQDIPLKAAAAQSIQIQTTIESIIDRRLSEVFEIHRMGKEKQSNRGDAE